MTSMDSTMDNRRLREVLQQMENLRLSTPVRNNDNTDDNKENILAGQDIPRIKSEEKSAETVPTPVFNSRDSNQAVHPIDKFNDILNLEEESKNSPPPHPAVESKSSVRSNVENFEISPENRDPFVYNCSNFQQTVLKKDHCGEDIKDLGNVLNDLNVTITLDECEESEDLIDVQISEDNLEGSFIEPEGNCQKQDISGIHKNNIRTSLSTLVDFENASTASDESVLNSSNRGQQDVQENKVSLLPNIDPEKISIGVGENNSSDQISGVPDCKRHAVEPVENETASIDNTEIDPRELPAIEPKLNSTLTISTEIQQTLPDCPASTQDTLSVTSEERVDSVVCTDNHKAESTFINYENIQPELAEEVQEGNVLVNSVANCHVSDFVPPVTDLNDSKINLEVSSGDRQSLEFPIAGYSEELPNPENIVGKNISNSEECETNEKEINSELSNSVAELSVYEECTPVDEIPTNCSLNLISYVTNPVQTETDSVVVEKSNISSDYKSVNTTIVLENEIGEAPDSELEVLLNITTVNSEEINIDKSCVDLVSDISGDNLDSPDCVEETTETQPLPSSETSYTVANTTIEEYFDSSQDLVTEENSDLKNVSEKVSTENKSSSAFIVLSPPKRDVSRENSNIVNPQSSQENNSCFSPREEEKQIQEEKVIPDTAVVSVTSNNQHLEDASIDKAENLNTNELKEDHGHEKLNEIEPTSIPEKYIISIKEMADVNEKLQQENSDLKLELNASKQAKASLELEMGKKDEIILKTQAEALKKEQQLYQDIKTLKEELKEKSMLNEKNNVKELEEALKEAKAKESHALGELNARMNDELNYRKIMEEYEKTIAARIADSQKLKEENETVTRHLRNLELSFSDLHQKYERTKNIIDGFKTNEERLREKFVIFEETIRKQEEKYESLKAHARAQIEKSNKEIIQHREKYDSEVNKLNAIIKRLEIKSVALETSLEQKTKECIALAALCDEVTGKKV